MAEAYKAADLAAELNITPAELRRHLRALGTEKPEGGWQWPKKTDAGLQEIRKSLKARLKELASAEPKPGRKKAEAAPAAEEEVAPKAKKKSKKKAKS